MHVFTDHENLLYVLAPLALRSSSLGHELFKVNRWAIHLSRFELCISHIERAHNVLVDILTGCSKGYRGTSAQKVAALYKEILPSAHLVNTISVEGIINEQRKHHYPAGGKKDADGVYMKGQQIWIPDDATNLKLRTTVEAHCGERGHCDYDATIAIVTQSYWWTEVKEDVREFTQSCIHCTMSRTVERILRPLSNALHGSKFKEVERAIFLYIGPAVYCKLMYVLVIMDGISSYTWFHACANGDSDAATNTL